MRALLHLTVILPKYIPQPINDWVLTQNINPKEIVTSSGIVLPQDEVREDLAAVISVGQGMLTGTGAFTPFYIKPGDIVRTTRKKGRTAYLDCMGEGGMGDSQTAYNYYQWSEILAVEYHSEALAQDIANIKRDNPIIICMAEEDHYRDTVKEKAEQEKAALEKKMNEKIEKKNFRESVLKQVFAPEPIEIVEDTTEE